MYYIQVPRSEPRPDELYHHGIHGMRWGRKNGPPYPLDYESHSSEEKRQNTKKELSAYTDSNGEQSLKRYKKTGKTADISKKESKKNRSSDIDDDPKTTRHLKKQLGLSDQEAADVKKYAKIAGISLVTAAGVVAAGYYLSQRNSRSLIRVTSQGLRRFNNSPLQWSYNLDHRLFNNRFNGEYIGKLAREHGFTETTGKRLRDAISNRKASSMSLDSICYNVRQKQLCHGSFRRLSCWSASQSYFMSALTGKEFASKSFENLANFNDFGKLYTKQPEIFTVYGDKAKNFVGKFGKTFTRCSDRTANSLVENIFKNISEKNNLTPDGKSTIGFINAAYHSDTCTHQFNFDITKLDDMKTKVLYIADGYTGERYPVAKLLENGQVEKIGSGMKKLGRELHHYNLDSVRFYAPSLDSINLDMMAKVVLEKVF